MSPLVKLANWIGVTLGIAAVWVLFFHAVEWAVRVIW